MSSRSDRRRKYILIGLALLALVMHGVLELTRTSVKQRDYDLKLRAAELAGQHGLLREAVHPLRELRERARREIAQLTRKLLAMARDNEESRRLMTVPGIGPINALAFCAAAKSPQAFTAPSFFFGKRSFFSGGKRSRLP